MMVGIRDLTPDMFSGLVPDEPPTSGYEALRSAWKASRLDKGRASQGWYADGCKRRCERFLRVYGIDPLVASIEAYARTRPGVYVQQFSTFFGPEKATFLEFLPTTPAKLAKESSPATAPTPTIDDYDDGYVNSTRESCRFCGTTVEDMDRAGVIAWRATGACSEVCQQAQWSLEA